MVTVHWTDACELMVVVIHIENLLLLGSQILVNLLLSSILILVLLSINHGEPHCSWHEYIIILSLVDHSIGGLNLLLMDVVVLVD